jgi:hypothetical protein
MAKAAGRAAGTTLEALNALARAAEVHALVMLETAIALRAVAEQEAKPAASGTS